MKTPIEVAKWYFKQGVKSDGVGSWLFAQGDDVHWCAAFALACCRESGNWMEASLKQRGVLRSVPELVMMAKQRGLWRGSLDQTLFNLPTADYVGALYVVERAGNPHGHVGVLDVVESGFVRGIEGNVTDSVKSISRKAEKVTGYVMVPRGGV